MKIIPIAADSLGTRSMATFVETADCGIFIDPAVSLAPKRYSLPPHELEYRRMEEHREKIKEYAARADVLVITHYHYDHHDPFSEMFKGKTMLIKHPAENINHSQKGRAGFFLNRVRGLPEVIEYADGREFSFGKTLLRFSDSVFHGTSGRLGFVIEVCIREGEECFFFTSDVEGPNTKEQTDFIIREPGRRGGKHAQDS